MCIRDSHTFDLNGDYFSNLINNYITLEDIKFHNLYYETEDNEHTLLRYSSHYIGSGNLYVVFMNSTTCYDLYLNSYSTAVSYTHLGRCDN